MLVYGGVVYRGEGGSGNSVFGLLKLDDEKSTRNTFLLV